MIVKQSIKNEKAGMKELPISIASFPKIVEKNLIYVDKTEYLYPLIKKDFKLQNDFFKLFWALWKDNLKYF